jgi:microcystin-dependent protein
VSLFRVFSQVEINYYYKIGLINKPKIDFKVFITIIFKLRDMAYVGEIRMFAGNFAPNGWQFCAGQLMPISENDTLFTLIGTTYGGDGEETFALPDLRGRAPMHMGQGPGLSSNRFLGEAAGAEQVTVTVQQLPSHTHPLITDASLANQPSPANGYLAQPNQTLIYKPAAPAAVLNANSISPTGGSQPHENMQPYLVINYIISLFGIFPTPN